MAHTKASGVTKGNRDSKAKMLGVKLFAGEIAKSGSILIRQRGSKFNAGAGTQKGSDDTIFAVRDGKVSFTKKLGKSYLTVN